MSTTIRIPRIDTTRADWFDAAVAAITAAAGYAPDWEATDAAIYGGDDHGDTAGYFRDEQGRLFIARIDESEATDEADSIHLVELDETEECRLRVLRAVKRAVAQPLR